MALQPGDIVKVYWRVFWRQHRMFHLSDGRLGVVDVKGSFHARAARSKVQKREYVLEYLCDAAAERAHNQYA